jgi:pimeloyl-ACP methyl ester carboxylesterase
MKYWSEIILPSIQNLHLTAEDLAKVKTPVLTIHGTRDRSAPYGGGREWALLLPNAQLVTVENAGHAPWIEAPEKVFGAMNTFLGGAWPESAEKVKSLDPNDERANSPVP